MASPLRLEYLSPRYNRASHQSAVLTPKGNRRLIKYERPNLVPNRAAYSSPSSWSPRTNQNDYFRQNKFINRKRYRSIDDFTNRSPFMSSNRRAFVANSRTPGRSYYGNLKTVQLGLMPGKHRQATFSNPDISV